MSGDSGESRRIEAPKRAKSPLWLHFGFVKDESGKMKDPKHVSCKLCGKDVAYSGNTTNLKQHMLNHHPGELPGPSTSGGVSSSTKMKQPTVEAFVARPVVKMAKSSKRAQVLTRGIAEFVAKDLRPIGVVEGEGFQRLIQMLEPAYTVPSRKTISKELKVMQEKSRKMLRVS